MCGLRPSHRSINFGADCIGCSVIDDFTWKYSPISTTSLWNRRKLDVHMHILVVIHFQFSLLQTSHAMVIFVPEYGRQLACFFVRPRSDFLFFHSWHGNAFLVGFVKSRLPLEKRTQDTWELKLCGSLFGFHLSSASTPLCSGMSLFDKCTPVYVLSWRASFKPWKKG